MTKPAVNEEGYLLDSADWTEDFAMSTAKELKVKLTQKHWELIKYLREQHARGVEMSIRKIGKSGLTDIKEFYELFPGGPLKNASKIAGLPRPSSCV
ncbi:MAG: TusE/DsrC/DsvC family sulfur relay protein [Candidatus Saccharimonadales bacterium]|nr:TusE/DsrC/DsvC family sulfur relay protein [Candidatus Saccharimonadales bacterium]